MVASHSSFRHWRLGIVAGVAVGALALAGCTEGGGGGGADGGGTGVPYGSSAADFQAALADMEPVNLVLQSGSASAEASGGENSVKLKDYIEEMSGGKITVEIVFAYGIAGPNDIDSAIGDGRIDLAQTFPIYEPSEYPANSVLVDTTILNPPGMVFGLLAGGAAVLEYGWREPAFAEELLAASGNHMVVPLNPSLPPVVACKEPLRTLADFEGKQLRGSGAALTKEMEALGGVTVATPLTEIYEAMQRGIIDCSTTGFGTALTMGFIPLAPYMLYSDTLSMPQATLPFVWSDKVESLPLPARQLIFDAAQQHMLWTLEYGWDVTTTTVIADVEAANGEFIPFDAESDAAIAAANEAIVDNYAATTAFDASELRPTVEALQEKWAGIVADLGVEPDGPLGEFNSWYTPGSVDLDGWLDALYEEVLNEYRPA